MPDAALVAITIVWGMTFVTVKNALNDADPITFLALRFSIAAIAAIAMAGRSILSQRVLLRGAVLGVFLFGGYLLQTLGLHSTTPTRSAFITGMTVVFVPFVAWGMRRARPSLFSWAAALAALLGLSVLTQFDIRAVAPTGDLLTLGCAVIYAFHIATTERFAANTPPMALVAVQIAVTALASIALMPFGDRFFRPTPSLAIAVAATGLVASAIAISVQTWAQARTSSIRAAIIFSLEPVVATIYSAQVGDHQISQNEIVGGAIVVAAILVSAIEPKLTHAVKTRMQWRRSPR